MSPPVVEIVTMPLGRLKGDHSLMQPIADELYKQPGCKKVSWGVLTEDPNTGVAILVWDTVEDHYTFQKHESYGPFIEKFVSLLSGPPTIIHVPIKPEPPNKAIEGPIVEFTLFDPNDAPNAKEELLKVTKEILDLADKHPKCYGTALGNSIEKPDQLVLLLSWPTVEAHTNEYRTQPAFEPLKERLMKVVSNVSIVHFETKHI